MKNFAFVLSLVALVLGQSANALADDSVFEDRPLETIKEVFLKGSIDGKNLFMVLGVEDALKINKEIAKWAVDADDLKELRDHVYNKDHHNDAYDRVSGAGEFSKEMAPHILQAPWRTLKEIPKSYRVNFDRAQRGYLQAKNPVSGVLKYSGWAVWANIQGAYYLVIEAPVEFVGATVLTVGAVPAAMTWQLIVTAQDLTVITLKIAAGLVAVTAVEAYALLSSVTATTFTVIATTGVAIYKGTKWLIFGFGHGSRFPVRVRQATGLSLEEHQRVADATAKTLAAALPAAQIESKMGKYKSRFSITVRSVEGKETLMARVSTAVRKDNVTIEVEFTKAYLKLRQLEQGLSKPEIKKQLSEEASELIQQITQELQINADAA
ncbi:MAG: hypothetical protein A2X94_11700 [Bdellovibrionales bacterium GWB1_55_8]|nr:MAG: hypothetical protein A2X94_11700 [Bdellovibrionales bacterium GWB1_55_8]